MPDIELKDRVVRVVDDVLCRVLDGEAVLLNLEDGTYFGLDPVGTRIWQLIDEERGTVRGILAALLREYDVDPEQCEEDLLRLLAELRSRGLITLVDGQAPSPR